jgi:hypothetical protein
LQPPRKIRRFSARSGKASLARSAASAAYYSGSNTDNPITNSYAITSFPAQEAECEKQGLLLLEWQPLPWVNFLGIRSRLAKLHQSSRHQFLHRTLPGERSSDSKRVPGSVTKRGNPRVRAALVECAWRMVRFQPQYPPVQKRLAVLAPQPRGSRALGAVRKKAIVAVARRLAVDLWRLHTGRCTAEQLGFTI